MFTVYTVSALARPPPRHRSINILVIYGLVAFTFYGLTSVQLLITAVI